MIRETLPILMALYTTESLQKLKDAIDLIDVASALIDLKKMGTSYKALCPFHEEKTPSFVIQPGDSHFHCFGCSEHGDAIALVMKVMQVGFVDAIEYLASRYSVVLEKQSSGKKGPSTAALKEILEKVAQFYQFILLRTKEGIPALSYLKKRGIDVEYIKKFGIGFAPKNGSLLKQVLQKQKVDLKLAQLAGVFNARGLDLFSERITFPIHDRMHGVIGFSARAIFPGYHGGKYINTPSTPLFKKSNVLFGLPFSKHRIAKEKKAILVEGQIDALTLIDRGEDRVVATLGTAMTEGHITQLASLGVQEVDLVFDSDSAGKKAAYKAASLLHSHQITTGVCLLPEDLDPHDLVLKEGIGGFAQILEKKKSYLEFSIEMLVADKDPQDPTVKSHIAQVLKKEIEGWSDPILIHESLKQLATLLDVPFHLMGIGSLPSFRQNSLRSHQANLKREIEMDLLYYLLFEDDEKHAFLKIAKDNLNEQHFSCSDCKALFLALMNRQDHQDLLQLCIDASDSAIQLLEELSKKRRQADKKLRPFLQTVEKLLQRKWFEQREEIKHKLQQGALGDEDAIALAKKFDQMKNQPPVLKT